MTGVPDELVEKAVERLVTVHFDGTGCGDPLSPGACSICFGGGHMSAREVAEEALEAVGLPALLERVEAAENQSVPIGDYEQALEDRNASRAERDADAAKVAAVRALVEEAEAASEHSFVRWFNGDKIPPSVSVTYLRAALTEAEHG